MEIKASQVKELRKLTGAGVMDCKQALKKFGDNQKEAIDWLRKKNLVVALKKSSRDANEGIISTYIHSNSKIGVMVEVNSETDFVSKNQLFRDFVKDIAMHIAAMNPLVIDETELSKADIETEKDFLRKKAIEEGKDKNHLDKILEGQIAKWKANKSLLTQPFVKDSL